MAEKNKLQKDLEAFPANRMEPVLLPRTGRAKGRGLDPVPERDLAELRARVREKRQEREMLRKKILV